MDISSFNTMEKEEAGRLLNAACGSAKWCKLIVEGRPYQSVANLMKRASEVWYNECSEAEWKEAFTHHPKIGEKDLAKKFPGTHQIAGKEQSGVSNAPARIITELSEANEKYENRFGFIFIVCATGKSASEMLRLVKDRTENSKEEELRIAMGEQQKITDLRLQNIFTSENINASLRSHVTTHVLDTSSGVPAEGITVKLQEASGDQWFTIAQGVTNIDGRVADLLPTSKKLNPGVYKMVFKTGAYFQEKKTNTFYPVVEICFRIFDNSHYHVPLLLNPFGYSTYRGS